MTLPQPATELKTHPLDTELDLARDRYIRNRPKSAAAFNLSANFMPGGNTRTVLFHSLFPLRIVSGAGCRVTDADGLEYVNLLGEYTAGLFGHNHPVIRKAIDAALDRGLNLSGHNPDEIKLAELVCARFPSIDKVRFTNSGTEASAGFEKTAIPDEGRLFVWTSGNIVHELPQELLEDMTLCVADDHPSHNRGNDPTLVDDGVAYLVDDDRERKRYSVLKPVRDHTTPTQEHGQENAAGKSNSRQSRSTPSAAAKPASSSLMLNLGILRTVVCLKRDGSRRN
ncbi:MAG: aminotransferase class III-fold pyridoxal phosphate-dependent enzyme [Proteobacteria bacterium]|nr:aminotransferase class III-fold pyridoxal phosphate-dependent enzyme [Pseudomonadota bacterium]